MPAATRKDPASYLSQPIEERVRMDLAAIDASFNRASKSKEAAISFLQRAGILDKNGKLAKEYRRR